MAEYLTPGVFLEDIKNVVDMPVGADPVAAFVGITATGPVGVPVLVESWNAFLNTFATAQDSAFLSNSYLAYAVYGFFQNGGRRCYVTRVSNGSVSSGAVTYNAAAAHCTATGDFQQSFSAKTEGAWGNNITVLIPVAEVDATAGTFSVIVKYNGIVVEKFTNLKKGTNVSGCFADVINADSNYIKITNLAVEAPLSTIEADTTLTLTGGSDGLASSGQPVPDTVYAAALSTFDFIDEIRLVAIPGASNSLQASVAQYCTNTKYRIAICEGQVSSTNSELINLRGTLNDQNAALYAPWVKVVNPLSSSGALISVPACGHICGVYSRISATRGFWKAPAGTEATIRGAVDVVRVLSNADTDVLNPKGINAIIPKTNYGIVIWGARSCSSDLNYTTGMYTNMTIKKNLYDLTQKYVFEPHDSSLWLRVRTTCQDYLESLRMQGAFAGDSAKESYYVKCDAELNPESVRRQGKLNVEVGYADKKPAEFVIVKIAHELTNNQ